MLLAALILHPQFVQASRAYHVAGTVGFGDVVHMTGVVHGMGNIRPIRIAFMEGNGDFSTLDQREVESVFVPTIRLGKAHWHAFHALLFIITVGIKLHPVHTGCILPGVDVVIFGTGHTRHQGAADHRTLFRGWTPASVLVVRHRYPCHFQGILTAAVVASADNNNTILRFTG